MQSCWIGTAKFMFSPPPLTSTPTMLPSRSTAGPPEFPGFAAASVWISLRPNGADDATRDRAAEAERTTDEQELVAGTRPVRTASATAARSRPVARRCAGRRGPVCRSSPTTSALQRPSFRSSVTCSPIREHMVGGDHVEVAILDPAGEAGAEPVARLDREDALRGSSPRAAQGRRPSCAASPRRPSRGPRAVIGKPEGSRRPSSVLNVGLEQVDLETLRLRPTRTRTARHPLPQVPPGRPRSWAAKAGASGLVVVVTHYSPLGTGTHSGTSSLVRGRLGERLFGRRRLGKVPGMRARRRSRISRLPPYSRPLRRSSPSRRSRITSTLGLSL